MNVVKRWEYQLHMAPEIEPAKDLVGFMRSFQRLKQMRKDEKQEIESNLYLLELKRVKSG